MTSRISNCTIETGDDCIIFVSGIPEWGPDYPCENITVTNCRLSSASAAIKFSEGNSNLIQHIAITNCAIFNCNRGITQAIATGGTRFAMLRSGILRWNSPALRLVLGGRRGTHLT